MIHFIAHHMCGTQLLGVNINKCGLCFFLEMWKHSDSLFCATQSKYFSKHNITFSFYVCISVFLRMICAAEYTQTRYSSHVQAVRQTHITLIKVDTMRVCIFFSLLPCWFLWNPVLLSLMRCLLFDWLYYSVLF